MLLIVRSQDPREHKTQQGTGNYLEKLQVHKDKRRRNEENKMITYWRNLLTYLISIPAGFMCCSLMRHQFRYSFYKALCLVLAVLTLTIPVAAWADTYTDMESGIILAFLLIACFIPYIISIKAHISKSIAIFVFVLAIVTLMSLTA